MKRLSVYLLACFLLVHCTLYAGGPWIPGKKKGLFIASLSPNIYTAISGSSGGLSLNRRVSDISLQLYAEYGITDRLGLVFNLPFKYVQTSSKLQNGGDFMTVLPSDRLFFPGNAELELKYNFFHKKKWLMTGGMKAEAPIAKYIDASGLRTGYNCWTLVPALYVGAGFSERFYGQLMGAYAYRTNNYNDEWRAALEIGYKLKKPFWIALLLEARQALQPKKQDEIAQNPDNNLQTGLYMVNEEYYAWAFKFSWNAKENLGLNWALAGGITTRYIARTPAFSFGVFYSW